MQVQEGVARMLEVHIQNFSYGKKEILNQIDLELPSSQIIGLVAPNGVGKSTLIQILSGHLRNNSIWCAIKGRIIQANHYL